MKPCREEIDGSPCVALLHRLRDRMDVPGAGGDGDAAGTVSGSLDGRSVLAAAAEDAPLMGDSVLSCDGTEFIDPLVSDDDVIEVERRARAQQAAEKSSN